MEGAALFLTTPGLAPAHGTHGRRWSVHSSGPPAARDFVQASGSSASAPHSPTRSESPSKARGAAASGAFFVTGCSYGPACVETAALPGGIALRSVSKPTGSRGLAPTAPTAAAGGPKSPYAVGMALPLRSPPPQQQQQQRRGSDGCALPQLPGAGAAAAAVSAGLPRSAMTPMPMPTRSRLFDIAALRPTSAPGRSVSPANRGPGDRVHDGDSAPRVATGSVAAALTKAHVATRDVHAMPSVFGLAPAPAGHHAPRRASLGATAAPAVVGKLAIGPAARATSKPRTHTMVAAVGDARLRDQTAAVVGGGKGPSKRGGAAMAAALAPIRTHAGGPASRTAVAAVASVVFGGDDGVDLFGVAAAAPWGMPTGSLGPATTGATSATRPARSRVGGGAIAAAPSRSLRSASNQRVSNPATAAVREPTAAAAIYAARSQPTHVRASSAGSRGVRSAPQQRLAAGSGYGAGSPARYSPVAHTDGDFAPFSPPTLHIHHNDGFGIAPPMSSGAAHPTTPSEALFASITADITSKLHERIKVAFDRVTGTMRASFDAAMQSPSKEVPAGGNAADPFAGADSLVPPAAVSQTAAPPAIDAVVVSGSGDDADASYSLIGVTHSVESVRVVKTPSGIWEAPSGGSTPVSRCGTARRSASADSAALQVAGSALDFSGAVPAAFAAAADAGHESHTAPASAASQPTAAQSGGPAMARLPSTLEAFLIDGVAYQAPGGVRVGPGRVKLGRVNSQIDDD